MQDMGPRDRSIRNIPVPQGHRRVSTVQEAPSEPVEQPHDNPPSSPPRTKTGGRRFFWIIVTAVVVVCIIVGLLLSTLFAGATVTVFERQESVAGPITFDAYLNPTTGNLGYGIMSGTRSATTTVPATGTEEVSRAASGVITVFNEFSSESQRLIARTRFEAPNGNVYRIQDSITVPGYKEEGGERIPGFIEATVYADAPGAEFNSSGETRYVLPALEGDPRYDTMYATGNSMTGGFEGTQPAVAEEDLAAAQRTLQEGLAQAAQSALAAQIPAGYLVIPGTLEVTYSDIVQTAQGDSTATISQTATMQAAIVRIDDLANAVAKERVSDYQGEAVTFVDSATLALSATPTEDQENTLSLNVSGNLDLKWRYDTEALQGALLGKEKDDFESIIQSFTPAISRAEAKIRPFWDSTFPEDPEDIELVEGQQ